MSDLRIEDELLRLPFEDHLAIWQAVEGKGSSRRQTQVAAQFKISVYAVGKIVSGIRALIQSFILASEQNGWATLAQLARTEMATWTLDQFGFGKTPRLKADKLFMSQVVDPAGELIRDYYSLKECSQYKVCRLWELANWVDNTRDMTLRLKARNRDLIMKALKEDKALYRTRPDLRWARVQRKLALQDR